MVTIFQFEITGNEVLSESSFFNRANALYNLDASKERLLRIEQEINENNRPLTKGEEIIMSEYNNVTNELMKIQDEILIDTGRMKFGQILPQDVIENKVMQSVSNKKLKNQYIQTKEKFDSFYKKNAKAIERVETKDNQLEQAKSQHTYELKVIDEHSKKLEEIDKNKAPRIPPHEIERLNKHIAELVEKGWDVKNMQPLISGFYGSFGSSSELRDGYGTIYSGGGYGCSFTHGLIILWEKK